MKTLTAEKNYSHEQQETRQNWRVAKWCLRKGIPVDTIENHPFWEHVSFLIQFQDEFEADYKSHAVHYNCVKAYWSIVLKDRKPLSRKAYNKFEKIALACLDIRQQQQATLNHIHQLRQQQQARATQNMDHDMMAKGSCSPQKLTHKGTNESAVEGLSLPW